MGTDANTIELRCSHERVYLHPQSEEVYALVCHDCDQVMELLQTILDKNCPHARVYFSARMKLCLECGVKLEGSQGRAKEKTAKSV